VFKILSCWLNCKESLDSDFATVGHMMSVHPVIFADATKNHSDHLLGILKGVARKLLKTQGMSDEQLDTCVANCVEQHQTFHQQTDHYNDTSKWRSHLALSGKSHLWHHLNTFERHWELGMVAC